MYKTIICYEGNSNINLLLVGKKKRVVIVPKGTLSSNKLMFVIAERLPS
jgi:hypothetical protein